MIKSCGKSSPHVLDNNAKLFIISAKDENVDNVRSLIRLLHPKAHDSYALQLAAEPYTLCGIVDPCIGSQTKANDSAALSMGAVYGHAECVKFLQP